MCLVTHIARKINLHYYRIDNETIYYGLDFTWYYKINIKICIDSSCVFKLFSKINSIQLKTESTPSHHLIESQKSTLKSRCERAYYNLKCKNFVRMIFLSFQCLNASLYKCTGCPILLGPLCFFVISLVLENLQRNFLPFFNSPGNLLHYSHKNFENWFRNSWDNWGQSWHLQHRNYFLDAV